LRGGEAAGHNFHPVKFWKFLLTLVSVVFASSGTLLFQPTVFGEITIPVLAKILGWKAQAVSARLSALGTLEIQGLEAVDEKKSRIAMDSAKVEFDPWTILSGKVEILRADFRFATVDLELPPPGQETKKPVPLPFSFLLREASADLVEGRLRMESGAWILKSAHASAEGWDGRTPREIRIQLGRLDWNGPGQQEITTTTQASAKKTRDATGGDLWEVKLTTDVSSVVNFPPWNLVSPCRLLMQGKVAQSTKGDWRIEGFQSAWQGVGGVRLAAKIGGTFAKTGEWTAELVLEPTDLQLVGIFLQPRGIQNFYGTMAGRVNLHGAPGKGLGVGVELNGQMVQLAAAGGVNWPAQPAALGISSRGEWRNAEGALKIENLAVNLGRVGQPADFQLSLDRPAVLQLTGKPDAQAPEPASLQWAARGLELAAVAPILIDPVNLKVEGGKISGSGQARIEGEKVGLGGKVESRSLTASGRWVQGQLAVQSATFDFQGYVKNAAKIHLESAQLRAAWEGGVTEDLALSAKAEWDWTKSEGFFAGDLTTGLTGLGQAWAGAKFWPSEGQAKAHLEFSGNVTQKGSGLLTMTLSGMRWPGDKGSPWGAELSSEVQVEQGAWTLPELALQAERAGETLLDARLSLLWKTGQDMGRLQVQLARAESAFVVPLLKNFTPDWKWTEASGKGSFTFTRENRHDQVKADLQAAVTVETGTAERPRPVDFSSVQGSVQATWPSGAEGEMAIQSLSLVAMHRDGTEAVRASLDAPLLLKKKGASGWGPAGTQASSGVIQFAGWPLGIVAPLILPKANESSIAGTLSGFLRVQSDPQRRCLAAQVDLISPDLSVHLPALRLPENQVNLKADVTLESDGDLTVRKVMLVSRQEGVDWLELSAEKAAQPGLAVVGKVNIGVLHENVPAVTPYVSAGSLVMKATVGEPKSGLRKVGFSAEAVGLNVFLPEIGAIPGLQADAQGILSWGANGFAAMDDLNLTARIPGAELRLGKVDYRKNGAVAWESARAPRGWVAILAQPWLRPNRWVDGDVVLGPGFWEPGDHGASGQIDLSMVEARISEKISPAPLSVRLEGNWEYDKRTRIFLLKEATLIFPEFKDDPVQIPLLQSGPGLFQVKLDGGALDLRGLLDLYGNWQSTGPAPAAKSEPTRLDIAADLDLIILPEARVGPVKISRFRYGPGGILLEPSSVEVQRGLLRGSLVQMGGLDRPYQIRLFAEKFPLGAILGPMIRDSRGPLGGWLDLKFSGQVTGTKFEDFQKSLSAQGSLRLYQAHLEYLPAIEKSLQIGGGFLGSSFIATSQINDLGAYANNLGADFMIRGTHVEIPDLKIIGSAVDIDLRGFLDWQSREISLRGPVRLSREAMASCSSFQGAMTQLVSKSNEFYTQLPGELTLKGTWQNPQPDFTEMQAGLESILNLAKNLLPTAVQGAGEAAGGATGAAGSLLQGVGNLFKGF